LRSNSYATCQAYCPGTPAGRRPEV
jgi:hypothetical protein